MPTSAVDLSSGLLELTGDAELEVFLNGPIDAVARGSVSTSMPDSTREGIRVSETVAEQTVPKRDAGRHADAEPAPGCGESPVVSASRFYSSVRGSHLTTSTKGVPHV